MAYDRDEMLASARADLIVHDTKGIAFMKRAKGGFSVDSDPAKTLLLMITMSEKSSKPINMYSLWIEGVEAKDTLLPLTSVKTAIGKLTKAGHKPSWDINKWGVLRLVLGNVKTEKAASGGATLEEMLKQYGLSK